MLKLIAVLSLVVGLRAEGVARRHAYYPPLARRLEGNCSSCDVCARVWAYEWVYYAPSTATITQTEVFAATDAASADETLTGSVGSEYAKAYESYQEYLSASGTRTAIKMGGDGEVTTITYPTPFMSIEQPWYWRGEYPDGDVCETAADFKEGTVKAPLEPLPAPGPLPLEDGSPDKQGAYYALGSKLTNVPITQYITDTPAKVCKSNCADAPASGPKPTMNAIAALPPTVTGALTVVFVTKCEKSVSGAQTVEACGNSAPAGGNGGGSTGGGSTGGGSTGGGSTGGGSTEGGSTGGDTEGGNTGGGDTGGNTGGNTGDGNSGGGSGTDNSGGDNNPSPAPRITTTDSAGNPVIVAATPAAGGGSNGAANADGGGIYATTNAQGQVVYATYAAGETPPPGALANGQVTLTDSSGATVVVQGGTLGAASGEGGGGGQPGAITVTNVEGMVVVVQGGTTGTLSVGADGGTALVAGTLTATSWVPGESVPGADRAAATSSTGLSGNGVALSPSGGLSLLMGTVAGTVVLMMLIL